MSYKLINWENSPSTKTPINAENLKHMDEGIAQAHDKADELSIYKANSIIATSSGTTFHETDCAAVPPVNIKLFGKGKQNTVPGNQILNPSMYQFSSGQVFKGVKTTINEDGSVTLSGAPVSTASGNLFALFTGDYIDVLKDGETYITNESIEIIENGTKNWVKMVTVDKSTMTSIRPYIQRTVENYVNGETVYPMFNQGDVVKPWEPYVGGEQSPNMRYPQKVDCLGEGGSIVGKVLRKNFLPNNAASKTENGVTFTVNSDKSITIKGTPTAETYLYLVATSDTRTLQKGKYVFTGGKDIVFISMYKPNWSLIENSRDGQEINIDLSEVTEYFCYITVRKDITYNTTIYPMIRPYGTDNTYESHSEDDQPFTALTPNGLRGIPLGQTIPDAIKNSPIHMSGVYWDSVEGRYYIADTKNEDGRDVQRINKYTLTEKDKGYMYVTESAVGKTFQLGGATMNQLIPIINCNDGAIVMSNVARGISYLERGSKDFISVYCGDGSALYFRDSLKNTLTIEEARNADITIWYVMAEPIVTETDAQCEVVMNYPNTTIVNDAGAHMQVTHVKDTQKHIEQNYIHKTEFSEALDRISALEQNAVNS